MHESESEVPQLCLTLSDPMVCSLPGSSVHWIFQARVLEWGAIAFSDSMSYCPLTQPTWSVNSSLHASQPWLHIKVTRGPFQNTCVRVPLPQILWFNCSGVGPGKWDFLMLLRWSKCTAKNKNHWARGRGMRLIKLIDSDTKAGNPDSPEKDP